MKVTLRQIAKKKGASREAIRKRRIKEGWRSCGRTIVKGGKGELFDLNDLLGDIRALFESEEKEPTALTGSPLALPFLKYQIYV